MENQVTRIALRCKRELKKGGKLKITPINCSISDVKAIQINNMKAEYFFQNAAVTTTQNDFRIYTVNNLQGESDIIIDVEYDIEQVNKPACRVEII